MLYAEVLDMHAKVRQMKIRIVQSHLPLVLDGNRRFVQVPDAALVQKLSNPALTLGFEAAVFFC
jgi:hypothetical protein